MSFKNSLSKHRIELLGDIVLLVRNPLGPKVEDEVGVGLAVDVHRVEVVGLHHVGADKHPDRLVAGKALQDREDLLKKKITAKISHHMHREFNLFSTKICSLPGRTHPGGQGP